jgi:glycosyltransferase involved in cell wall biosynthesis
MKIAIVTSGFNLEKPGGVSNVVLKVAAAIQQISEFEVLSFANEKTDPRSIQFFNPRTYRKLQPSRALHGNIPVWHIGAAGSEFEFLRYRKRKKLTTFFSSYDLILVVTGVLQLANVIPKVDVPVYVQCATRLKWERKSQYSRMSLRRQLALRSQTPFLAFQEHRVLRSQFRFLPENLIMHGWINKRARLKPLMWYPGIEAPLKYVARSDPNFKKAPYISVGRFGDRRKGWARLIEAYKLAYDTKGNLPGLNLIGWGQFDDLEGYDLKELQGQYPIRIYSNLSNADRDNMVMGSSIFLQASFEEGLGLAAIEATSFGLPVLASDTDGSREYVVNGSNGFRVPQGKHFIEDFAEAIISTDAWNYQEMSHKSREIFEEKFEKQISESNLLKILQISVT